MPTTAETRLHLILASVWIPLALILALAAIFAEAEKTSLGRARGAAAKEREALIGRRNRVAAELDWLASAPALDDAIHRLELPIAPPPRLAAR
jgi:hypothetical protein